MPLCYCSIRCGPNKPVYAEYGVCDSDSASVVYMSSTHECGPEGRDKSSIMVADAVGDTPKWVDKLVEPLSEGAPRIGFLARNQTDGLRKMLIILGINQ